MQSVNVDPVLVDFFVTWWSLAPGLILVFPDSRVTLFIVTLLLNRVLFFIKK